MSIGNKSVQRDTVDAMTMLLLLLPLACLNTFAINKVKAPGLGVLQKMRLPAETHGMEWKKRKSIFGGGVILIIDKTINRENILFTYSKCMLPCFRVRVDGWFGD